MVLVDGSIEDIKKYLFNRDDKLPIIFESFEIESQKKTYSNFQSLVRIIIGQQLSGAAAETIFSRLISLAGNNFSPDQLLKLSEQSFLSIGVSRAKASTT